MTICNMLSLLQGSAIFALPFAMVTGGLTFIPVAILLSVLADISSYLLIDCLYVTDSRSNMKQRIRWRYHDIASVSFGRFFGNAVLIVVMFYLICYNH